ncbi:hypothetical protein B0H19DRAFT_1256656 [Mycena capillaripes]|nr:hypothetical protein B0H19DRAFT_1256656 [Mycena capillaripes]
MAPKTTVTQNPLKSITSCLTVTADTLEILSDSLNTPFLGVISTTTQSLLKNIETIKQNKDDCAKLLEQTLELLNAIISVHIRSEAGAELPPSVLHNIGQFTTTLHQIYTFVEAQQTGSTLKRIFRQSEMSTLLKDCKLGLQQGLESFQIRTVNVMAEITEL